MGESNRYNTHFGWLYLLHFWPWFTLVRGRACTLEQWLRIHGIHRMGNFAGGYFLDSKKHVGTTHHSCIRWPGVDGGTFKLDESTNHQFGSCTSKLLVNYTCFGDYRRIWLLNFRCIAGFFKFDNHGVAKQKQL